MAGSNFYNSNASGYTSDSMGSGSWDDFYSGFTDPRKPIKPLGPNQPSGVVQNPNADQSRLMPDWLPSGNISTTPPVGTGLTSIPLPLPRPRPAIAPTANYMDTPEAAAAALAALGLGPDVLPPVPPATQVVPPALQAILAENPMFGTTLGGVPASVQIPNAMAGRMRISPNALIDGMKGRDNENGANYGGRSLGSDGIIRAYNNDTKRWDDLSQNSGRRQSPSQSYKKDRLGDRDMRRTRKPGPGR